MYARLSSITVRWQVQYHRALKIHYQVKLMHTNRVNVGYNHYEAMSSYDYSVVPVHVV